MREQRAFRFKRADPVTGTGNNVVGPATERDIAVRVPSRRVTCQIVSAIAGKAFCGALRVVKVTTLPEQHRGLCVDR